MAGRNDFAYVQARVQARHGTRPGGAEWRRLEAIADLAGYLHVLRETSLAPWIRPLTPAASSHEIEASLRERWSEYSVRVSGWSPSPWRPAIAWWSVLPVLPALQYLRQGGIPLAWFRDDPQLSSPESGAASELVLHDPLDAWLSRWHRLWPRISGSQRLALFGLQKAVGDHLQSMGAARDHAGDGENLRAGLEAAFRRFFRQHAQSAVAVFCHLGLTALDVERMRGGLIQRRLFPPGNGARQ
jgi:hypothetical protein